MAGPQARRLIFDISNIRWLRTVLSVVLLSGLSLGFCTGELWAHRGGRVYLDLHSRGSEVRLRVQGTPEDLKPTLAVASMVKPLPQLFRAAEAQVCKTVAGQVALVAKGGRRCEVQSCSLKASDGSVVVNTRYRCPRGRLKFRYDLLFDSDPDHRAFVSLRGGKKARLQILSRRKRELEFSQARSLWQEARSLLALGVEHILGGYDHILFLLALLLAAPTLSARTLFVGRTTAAAEQPNVEPSPPSLRVAVVYLLKIVTAFTVAHSVTLALAALDVINLPARIVEPMIALSIVYVALENCLLPRRPRSARYRWALVFVFGLIHGFGFAQILRETGLPPQGLLVGLLSFNLGVELGQVVTVLLLYPLIHLLALGRQSIRNALGMVGLLGGFFGLLMVCGIAVAYWPLVCLVLLGLAICATHRFGYRLATLYGGSGLIGVFGLLWLVQRVSGLELLGGVLG